MESQFWQDKLPCPQRIQELQKTFPKRSTQNSSSYLDTKRLPYGFLTQKGLDQCFQQGQHFYQKYSSQDDEYRKKNLSVYSTNYLRTVTSVQSFLQGYFSTSSTTTTTSNSHNNTDTTIPVQIRPLIHDPLNAFDRNPKLIQQFVSQIIQKQPQFIHHEHQVGIPLAQQLVQVLPGLQHSKAGFSRQTPTAINWVDASDHFICRKAHNLSLTQYTALHDFAEDKNQGATNTVLHELEKPVLQYVAWRFRQWYQYPPLLAIVTAPLLRSIYQQATTPSNTKLNTTSLQDQEVDPMVIFSCHDITLLGLLYALKAPQVQKDSDALDFWPPYASALVLEHFEDHWKVTFNEQEVVEFSTDDLQTLIESLEQQGELDYDAVMGWK